MANLLTAWSNWSEVSAPYVLEEDRTVLTSPRSTKATVTYKNWSEVYKAKDFAAPGDTRLHLGLLPHPFCGDVKNAEIYILMLNPGYGPHDYFGEYEVPEYRKAVLANLKQTFTSETLPFFLLDPQFSWHGGFNWWHGKLAGVIKELAHSRGVSFAEARSELGRKIASIELLPYHSTSFRDGDHWIRDLQSVKLARYYVKDYVLPRVANDKAIAIVTRQASVWNLPEHSGVIRYSGQEARAAHLSPSSPGGKAILGHIT
jgi:hypothetical protein